MKILFYSTECNLSNKLLEYINSNKLNIYFNMININTDKFPENISIVPTIIDTEIGTTFEGKSAFDYIINNKYFNKPTNNIDYWTKIPLPKPTIEEDSKAIEKHNFGFAAIETDVTPPVIVTEVVKKPIIFDRRTIALMKRRM